MPLSFQVYYSLGWIITLWPYWYKGMRPMYKSLPKSLLNAISDDTQIIVIEGPDSVGKSTLIKNAIDVFEDYGVILIPVRCPDNRDDVPIRQVIMSDGVATHPQCQSLLFLADFVYAYEKILKPVLRPGSKVKFIYDRFLVSTSCYQSVPLATLNTVLGLLAPEMCAAFSTAQYIYMDPIDLNAHVLRTQTKAGSEVNHLDPTSVDQVKQQIARYRKVRAEHGYNGILGSRKIEHFPVC